MKFIWNVQAVNNANGLSFVTDITAKTVNIIIINKNIKSIKVRRQDDYFSKRLPSAGKKIREMYVSRMNIKYKTVEEMIKKLQKIKIKTKLKFNQNFRNFLRWSELP